MQRLDLDFASHGRAHRWAGPLLLAIALGVSGDMAWRYVQLEHSVKSAEAKVARAQPRRAAFSASNEEVAVAKETVDRLGLPWAKLFSALESAASDQVALLAIEPDAKSGKVLISGDSKDYLAALSYVLNLSKTAGLADVQLLRHEVKKNDPQHAVSFQVSAAWSAAK
jgi:hypothetical protein